MNISKEIHRFIEDKVSWTQLPASIKSKLGNEYIEYNKLVLNFSLQNQLRFRDNLISKVFKSEKRYYEKLMVFSRENLFIYPYHLQDVIVGGLRITAYQYYIDLLCTIMSQEKSYDFIPNFTAADCLRLLGIGRNQYIDLMNILRGNHNNSSSNINNSSDSNKSGMVNAGKRFLGFGSNKKIDNIEKIRSLLPKEPVENLHIEPWWNVKCGIVLEPDINQCDESLRSVIDNIIDSSGIHAGSIDKNLLICLYCKGMVYFDVNIEADCVISVATLDKFVMNRTGGDYFEVLLYKIFVAIDENSTVESLASILEIPLDLIQQAVSVFCRLQFAHKKLSPASYSKYCLDKSWHDNNNSPWRSIRPVPSQSQDFNKFLLEDTIPDLYDEFDPNNNNISSVTNNTTTQYCDGDSFNTSCIKSSQSMFYSPSVDGDLVSLTHDQSDITSKAPSSTYHKKIGFVFDSSLTAFLMMGNLSVGLKNHAVTMFEVGKLSDEALDTFLTELDSISDVGEGEAQRYYDHAVNLRYTIRQLRSLVMKSANDASAGNSIGVDLIRAGSLLSLDTASRCRMLVRNYLALVYMAPINYTTGITTSLDNAILCPDYSLPQFGPYIPQMTSPWFRLFIYKYTGNGPTTLLINAGQRLTKLPEELCEFQRLLVSPWQQQHESMVVMASNVALVTINEALTHGPLLIQGLDYWCCSGYISNGNSSNSSNNGNGNNTNSASGLSNNSTYHSNHTNDMEKYIAFPLDESNSSSVIPGDLQPVIHQLDELIDLRVKCGYISYIQHYNNHHGHHQEHLHHPPSLLTVNFGVALFNDELNREILERLTRIDLLMDSDKNKPQAVETFVGRFTEFIRDYTSTTQSDMLPRYSLIFHKGLLNKYYN